LEQQAGSLSVSPKVMAIIGERSQARSEVGSDAGGIRNGYSCVNMAKDSEVKLDARGQAE
jgi:hypothetical protein